MGIRSGEPGGKAFPSLCNAVRDTGPVATLGRLSAALLQACSIAFKRSAACAGESVPSCTFSNKACSRERGMLEGAPGAATEVWLGDAAAAGDGHKPALIPPAEWACCSPCRLAACNFATSRAAVRAALPCLCCGVPCLSPFRTCSIDEEGSSFRSACVAARLRARSKSARAPAFLSSAMTVCSSRCRRASKARMSRKRRQYQVMGTQTYCPLSQNCTPKYTCARGGLDVNATETPQQQPGLRAQAHLHSREQ